MIRQDEFAKVLWHPSHFDALVSRHGAEAVVARAREEGIAPYLAWRLPGSALLADSRRAAVLDEALRHPATVHACEALGAVGVRPLILKGGAWAHTVYPAPWCRPRMDLDLLVPRHARGTAFAALRDAGFVPSGRISGELVNPQEAFTKPLAAGVTFTVDLHWQVSNRVVIAAAFPVDRMLARARPAPFAGGHALQADLIDSLFVACLHPVAHHANDLLLMWWLDVALLAEAVEAHDLGEVQARAAEAEVAGLVAHSLGEARRWCVGTGAAAPILSADFLASLRRIGARDASLELLNPSRGLLKDAWADLRGLPTGRARAALLREHVLPSADFMCARYGTSRRWLLPVLHVRRLVGGGARWLWQWLRGAA